jgi:non-ribosomal peptide synthase protein (TIGR01720 family)
VLLTALWQTCATWSSDSTCTVHVEGHGREPIVGDVDVSRTIGWFTSLYPVRLAYHDPDDAAGALQAIAGQVARLPHHGIGYGLLRYLSPAAAGSWRTAPEPDLSFNYLGQFDQIFANSSIFRVAREPRGPSHDPASVRPHALEVVGRVTDGVLELHWTYSTALHRPHTIEWLAAAYIDRLRTLLAHCRAGASAPLTPVDVAAHVSPREIEKLLRLARD